MGKQGLAHWLLADAYKTQRH